MNRRTLLKTLLAAPLLAPVSRLFGKGPEVPPRHFVASEGVPARYVRSISFQGLAGVFDFQVERVRTWGPVRPCQLSFVTDSSVSYKAPSDFKDLPGILWASEDQFVARAIAAARQANLLCLVSESEFERLDRVWLDQDLKELSRGEAFRVARLSGQVYAGEIYLPIPVKVD